MSHNYITYKNTENLSDDGKGKSIRLIVIQGTKIQTLFFQKENIGNVMQAK